MLNKSIKITKKVIIINQKTDIICENFDLQNKEPQQNEQNNIKQDRNNSNYQDQSKQYKNTFEQYQLNDIDKQQQLQEMKEISNKYNEKIKHIQEIIQILKKRTKLLEQKIKKENNIDKCKRNRRLSKEVMKQFKCKIKDCEREYGSIVSLRLHQRLKHQNN